MELYSDFRDGEIVANVEWLEASAFPISRLFDLLGDFDGIDIVLEGELDGRRNEKARDAFVAMLRDDIEPVRSAEGVGLTNCAMGNFSTEEADDLFSDDGDETTEEWVVVEMLRDGENEVIDFFIVDDWVVVRMLCHPACVEKTKPRNVLELCRENVIHDGGSPRIS